MSDGGLLARAVATLVRELPSGTVERLLAVLEAPLPTRAAMRACVTRPVAVERLNAVLTLADDRTVDDRTIALMVRAAIAAEQGHARDGRVELVWTGPNPPATALYRTEQTLINIIQGAKTHLLVVTFAAYKVEAVREALAAAAARGVRVSIVIEQAIEDGGRVSFSPLDALTNRQATANLTVYTWPRDCRPTTHDGRVGSLHAKCAVADDEVLLVSSANLTAFALELNMELGVLITGGAEPRRVREHFGELIRRGILKPTSAAARASRETENGSR